MKVVLSSIGASNWSFVPGRRGFSNTVRAKQGISSIPATAEVGTPATWVELGRAVVIGVGLVNIRARVQATSASATADVLYLTFQWSKDGGATWIDINQTNSQIVTIPVLTVAAAAARFGSHHEETLLMSGKGKVVIRLVGYHSDVHPSVATTVHAAVLFVQGNIVESKV